MEPNRTPWRAFGEGYSYVGLGCSFAAGIVLFMGAGWLLDRWLGTIPLFVIVGTLLGAVLSFLSVYRRLQIDAERRRRERGEE